jgi:hypothetical protein
VHESQDANRALGALATVSLEVELAQLQPRSRRSCRCCPSGPPP